MEITAAVSRGANNPLTIDRVTLAEPGRGEVLVGLVASGICHTDLIARNNFPAELPIVLGHEGAGVVLRVGDDVAGITVGDHVVLTYQSCGTCPKCDAGLPGYCAQWAILNAGKFGPESPLSSGEEFITGSFFGQSSFGSHVLATPRNIVVVDRDLDLAEICAFGCGVQTGAGTVANVLSPDSSSTLAVFGVGGVGMAAVLAARALGVGTVVAIDVSPTRLELARQLGADAAIDSTEGNVAERIVSAVGNPVTHALDTTGRPEVIAAAIDALAPLGTLALVALGEATIPIEVAKLTGQGKSLRGSIEGDANPHTFIPQLLDWYREGKFPMNKVVRRYPIDQINQAVADAHSGVTIKPVLMFPT